MYICSTMYLPLSLTCKKQDDLHEETDCKINYKKQNNLFFTYKLHKRQHKHFFISIDRIWMIQEVMNDQIENEIKIE